jgi:dimethylhistidine N-methyltransferase
MAVARDLQRAATERAKECTLMRELALASAEGSGTTLAQWRHEVLTGLGAPQKRLSPKYLYDTLGSRLFDEICTLPEYYATRTELMLLRAHGPEIASLVGPRAQIVELGAGSNVKARLLLAALREPQAYLPIDVSAEYLAEQAVEIALDFPHLAVLPVPADFTRPFVLPPGMRRERTLVFFPGSTIGNLSRVRAAALLESLAERVGGALLLGVDVCRDPAALHAAYNDARGVTAAFNLNLLARLNRELGADFDLASFDHEAAYDARHSRIEMRLVSRSAQVVTVAGVPFAFRAGEYIVSEHSHKYAPEQLEEMAATAGWRTERSWIDGSSRFAVYFFRSK